MDNFRIIYRILKILEKALDYDEFDYSVLCAEEMKTTPERFEKLLIMLQQDGYVEGLHIYSFMSDKGACHVRQPIQPRITLKGLEYLSENSMMKKLHEAAKGVMELIP